MMLLGKYLDCRESITYKNITNDHFLNSRMTLNNYDFLD